MPDIPVQPETYARLQKHAKPFVDTPDTVINKALDALEQLGAAAPQNAPAAEGERRIDLRNLPKLTHTKVLDAKIGGDPIAKPNWNMLLDLMLVRTMKSTGNFDRLQRLCPVNMVKGRKEDEGYGYLPEIDISVQGQDANAACRAIVTAAQGLGIGLDIGFMWRPKESAAYPGERARITVAPASHANTTTNGKAPAQLSA